MIAALDQNSGSTQRRRAQEQPHHHQFDRKSYHPSHSILGIDILQFDCCRFNRPHPLLEATANR